MRLRLNGGDPHGPLPHFLFFQDQRIRAGSSLSAHSDAEATEIATLLYDACSDVIDSCEIWRGADCVARIDRQSAPPSESLEDSAEAPRSHVIQLAETLQNSFSFIRESRRLREKLERLR
jgi:hypothetical protein